MKNSATFIAGFGVLTLLLLIPNTGNTKPDDVRYSVLTNQGHTILSAAFNPRDIHMLATGGSDGTIRVWNTSTRALLYIIYYDKDLILSLAFSPDGSVLASGSADGNVRLWNVGTGKLQHKLSEHTDLVTSLAFSADGSVLASGSEDGTIRLWDPDTGQQQNALTGYDVPVLSLAFSPIGKVLATGRADTRVRVWNLETGRLQHTLEGHKDLVLSLAFGPNNGMLASGGADGRVFLWKTSPGVLLKTFTAHTNWVNTVAFHGTTLASGSFDKTIRLWNVDTRTLQQTLTAHTQSVESLAFNTNGSLLASGSADGKVLLWELTASQTASQILADVNGDGVVNRLDLEAVNTRLGRSERSPADVNTDGIVNITDLVLVTNAIEATAAERKALVSGRTDVNNDNVVDMSDLEAIDERLGMTGQSPADVNIDGVVNIVDLVLVANAINLATVAAPAFHNRVTALITAERIQGWLTEARLSEEPSLAYQRGVLVLEQLLAILTPETTVLLPNYPNPFNPETWIPYRLAAATDVGVRIYGANGTLVRTLEMGQQPAGLYESRARAAYWDGKNELGEPVASGLYFYTLTAGEFTATRKMLIRK